MHHLANKSIPKTSNKNLSYKEKEEYNKAAWEWQEKALNYLIEAKADINSTNNDGLTPVILAAKRKNTRILQVLISNDPDLTVFTDQGGLFHFLASFDLEFNKIVKDIIKKLGVNKETLNYLDENGFSPFLKFVKH